MVFLSWVKAKFGKAEPAVETEPLPQILRYHRLASDLVLKLFGEARPWVSDETTLWEFHDGESNEPYYAMIDERYGVDVREIEGARLLPICEKIDREAAVRSWFRETPVGPESL